MIHSSGKRGRYKRYLSMLIAFIMICSVFLPAFAENAGGKTDGEASGKAVAVATYEFYADDSLHDSQTVKDGETLKEPSEPQKDGSTFEGWYTEKDGGSKFTDFSKQSVTESKTVKLYARWQKVEEPEPEAESVEADTDKDTSGNDMENSEEVSDGQEISEDKDTTSDKADASDDKNSENVSATEEDDKKDVSDTDKGNVSTDQSENVASETDETEAMEPTESSDAKKEDAAADDTEKSEDESDTEKNDTEKNNTEKNDTENVTDEKSEAADSADIVDPADGTAQKEENIANTQPQPQLEINSGISPLRITGEKTVAVGDTIELTGGGQWIGSNHQWSAESLGGEVSLTGQNNWTVTVRGIRAGWVKLTHTYYIMFSGNQTEEINIQVTEASSGQSYDLYMYTLIPGVEEGSSDNADDVWNGMGIGSISNVAPPGSYDVMTDIDDGYGSSGAVINDKDQNNREYPPITVTENGRETTYYYAKTDAQEAQKGYYTIQWMRVRVSDGANDGNNDFNKPEVASGNNTYHLDGIVILNEENIYTVNFALKDVGGTRFIPDENFATRVKAGYDASNLKRPDKDQVLDSQGKPIAGYPYQQPKIVNGITYTFDGWYTDETCKTKVDFDNYTINKNTTFYARYIPETQDVTVEKQVVGTTQEDATREFSFTYKYVDNSGVEKTGTLSLSDGKNGSIKDVPVGADLVLTETNASGYTTSAQYDDKTIQANETTGDTRTMTVQTTNNDSKIVVTNRKQIDETEPDANFIIVEKKFTGITENQIPDNFQITVSGSVQSYILTKNTYNWSEKVNDDGSITWRWKITGVGIGKYTVSEDNDKITDYTVTTTGDNGSVDVEAAEITVDVVKHETTCKQNNWSVGVENNKNFLFAATLTSNSGVMVISKEPLSASVRAAVAAKVKTINGPWNGSVHFYSVSENGYEYSIDGKIFTYDPTAGEIVIANTSDWSHVASLSYDVTDASNPEIAITNAYEKNTSSIEVKKLVTGNLSDYDKKFNFTASWEGSDGTESKNFLLKHNASEVLEDLPVGTQVTISENRDDYDLVNIKQGEEVLENVTSSGSTSSCTVTVTKEPMTITFTNEKEAVPDVGIRMDNLPYILMLALVAGGAAAAVILRRRRD